MNIIFSQDAICGDARGSVRTMATAIMLAVVLALGTACEQPTVPDYNNPSESEFVSITALSQVQAMATGLVAGDRNYIGNEIMFGETMGRDLYRLDNAEPRYIIELLGPSIDASNFIGTSTWPYSVSHLADIMIKGSAAANSGVMNDAQKQAAIGFAQTFKALEYIRAIETRDTLGIPFGTDLDGGALAPIRCKPAVLDGISAILDSAAVALSAGSAVFPFELPAGFAGFTTPATFLKFNRALAAKVDIYRAFKGYATSGVIDQGALNDAVTALGQSFITTTPGQLNTGPVHLFSTATGEVVNPLYQALGSTIFRANPRVVSEAEAGDRRVAANTTIGQLKSVSGASSNVLITRYASNTSSIPIITNKELILMRAEAQWGLGNLPGAMTDVNLIRQTDGNLAPVALTTSDAVLTEILKQKRYSLLFESPARWVDARMFGRLVGEPPLGVGKERTFDPLAVMPIPATEANGRNGNIACTQ